MTFSDQLKAFMNELNCSAKELSSLSGVSAPVISRYLHEERVPNADSSTVKAIAGGLALIASNRNINLTNDEIATALKSTLSVNIRDFAHSVEMLKKLLKKLDISNSKFARAMSFDSSLISRIFSGQRKPSNLEGFIMNACEYIARAVPGETIRLALHDLIGTTDEPSVFENSSRLSAYLYTCITSETAVPQANPVEEFLHVFDSFDLNEYIRSLHFDETDIPSAASGMPVTKIYNGEDEIMAAELAFLQTTAISHSQKDVTMYSDMPIEEIFANSEFAKKWMLGMSLLLKKGLHLNMIHNVSRPFNEIMIGLELYIPMYMTGQISPYYLKEASGNPFIHTLRVSGSAVLTGEAISGHYKDARCILSKSKDEIAYYTKCAENLLDKASPLMNIYRRDTLREYRNFLYSDLQENTKPLYLRYSTLPLFTISDELLDRILLRNKIDTKTVAAIKEHVVFLRHIHAMARSHCRIILEIPELTDEELVKYPLNLGLSGIFIENDIQYTPEDYHEHLALTMKTADDNVEIITTPTVPFRNIQIAIRSGEWVVISKSKAPAIHFCIKHPVIVRALTDFAPPIRD